MRLSKYIPWIGAAVSALEWADGVGKLPALGWNSWNAFGCDIDESSFLDAAQQMVSRGFKDAGYEYVNIDDCWSVRSGRDGETQQLVPDPDKFPDGIRGLAQKVHHLGLKIGIYSSAGTLTCAGYPASIGYESIDAATFAAWDIDYLKYDNCYVPQNWTDECTSCTFYEADNCCPSDHDYSQSHTAARYDAMRDALQAQNRTIMYSLCEWGDANVWEWANATGNSWRTTGDITASFDSVLDLLNINSFITNYTDFWGHGDPDMLEVGNAGLSVAEARSHFAFWAAMKSPLIIGTDLTTVEQEFVDILLNPHLLAFNQDPVYGSAAAPYQWGTNPDGTFNATNPAEFWSGESSQGTLVLMLNTLDAARNMTADFSEIPGGHCADGCSATDVWTGEDMGCYADGVTMSVESHDTAVLLLQEPCA